MSALPAQSGTATTVSPTPVLEDKSGTTRIRSAPASTTSSSSMESALLPLSLVPTAESSMLRLGSASAPLAPGIVAARATPCPPAPATESTVP